MYVSVQNDHTCCGILIYGFSETLKYVQFYFSCQEVTKVICQNVEVSMLTMLITPVPPQLRIMLLIELNLVKEVGHGGVRGHGCEEIRASGDGVWKNISRSLAALNTILKKKISKIFGPL